MGEAEGRDKTREREEGEKGKRDGGGGVGRER